jgi:hypothetical protein
MLLDFDPQVTVIAAQPFWLRWRDDAGIPGGPTAVLARARTRS